MYYWIIDELNDIYYVPWNFAGPIFRNNEAQSAWLAGRRTAGMIVTAIFKAFEIC